MQPRVVAVFYITTSALPTLMLAEEGMTQQYEKKNTAEKIDGSIDSANEKFNHKVNNLLDRSAVVLAGIAKTYNIPATGMKVAAGAAGLIGGWLFISTYVHGRSGYYESEMAGMFVSLGIGAVLIAVATACWRAAKLVDVPTSAKARTPEKTKPVTHTPAATTKPKAVTAPAQKNADISWLVYAVSTALTLFLIMKPASSVWVWEIKQNYILLVWGWAILTGIYAWYRFQGGKWTLSLGGFPLTLIIFLINIGLIFLLFAQYP